MFCSGKTKTVKPTHVNINDDDDDDTITHVIVVNNAHVNKDGDNDGNTNKNSVRKITRPTIKTKITTTTTKNAYGKYLISNIQILKKKVIGKCL